MKFVARWGWKAELARRLGVDPSFVSRIMSGERQPNATMALKLYRATGIAPLSWLYPDDYANPLMQIHLLEMKKRRGVKK